jgi:hypothetical protein
MGLPGKVGIVWDGFKDFTGICGLAIVFSDEFLLKVHDATSMFRRSAYTDFR